ncbi:hypothetical protein BKA04_000052 [Cryobacterium mesophilum]|uniref:DUF3093 domain-containing protein n=1 Tax=Terrimesophilobacter mesophilus TaxID=433647 RepID=A0A4R8V7W4_9MICO|nr:DUF3093 domain-containing protein [Terrimesophilobacter mesophilus]MBB5631829.1 hypothetical protein [Terrimesophilobacter mesophilus]TFB78743.1 DUF3093 domain-containing protein [Terrimesophilobacter mesophilus]
MTIYRERLWASAWVYLALALVIPASLLVFWPISVLAGVIVAIVLYAGCVGIVIAASPSIVVTDSQLIAGRARLPLGLVGTVEKFQEPEATLQRGQRLDARAWLLIRGWIGPVVKVEVLDPADPTPYWLVSTRHPDALAGALTGVRPA